MTVTSPQLANRLADLTQLLDEHHLVVLSEDPSRRYAFGRLMARHLGGLPHAQVLRFDGVGALDAGGVVRALQPVMRIRPRASHDITGIVRLLRYTPGQVRHRFIIWDDADEMLEHDVRQFSEIVNAMMAVAAEHEHITPEPLIVQRMMFIGGDKLGAYAEEEGGQFCQWLAAPGGAPFRAIRRYVDRPPVLTYRLDG
ncbi:MAG: hypothetical protein ACYTGC_00375 [Planctomycetota bacterium]